jgi:hypothetical protein
MSDPEMIAAVLRDRSVGFQRTARLNETSREMSFVGLFAAKGQAGSGIGRWFCAASTRRTSRHSIPSCRGP